MSVESGRWQEECWLLVGWSQAAAAASVTRLTGLCFSARAQEEEEREKKKCAVSFIARKRKVCSACGFWMRAQTQQVITVTLTQRASERRVLLEASG